MTIVLTPAETEILFIAKSCEPNVTVNESRFVEKFWPVIVISLTPAAAVLAGDTLDIYGPLDNGLFGSHTAEGASKWLHAQRKKSVKMSKQKIKCIVFISIPFYMFTLRKIL
jgi:hypothetical protein